VRTLFQRDDLPPDDEKLLTAGVDIGMRSVKIALLTHGTGTPRVMATEIVAVQGRRDARDAEVAVRESWARVLRAGGVAPVDIALVASTGTQERAVVHVGHFYRGASLAAGIRFLSPDAVAALDVGARQMRCFRLDGTKADRHHAATRKDLICGGELLEAIARRSGVSIEAAGLLPAGVVAYDDLAARAAKLLGALALGGPTVITGALALNQGFVRVLARRLAEDRSSTTLLVRPDAIFAAAYGAALLAARRYRRATGPNASSAPSSERRPPLRVGRLILN
jgi:activator of 2-hydroxyglutaryl-CoA dehydratase